MSNSRKTTRLIKIMAMAALILGVALIGAWHHHGDGLAHPECLICYVYAGLGSVVVPAAAVLPAVVAVFIFLSFAKSVLPEQSPVFSQNPRSPPSFY
jgi:hypothetical protein